MERPGEAGELLYTQTNHSKKAAPRFVSESCESAQGAKRDRDEDYPMGSFSVHGRAW